MGDIMKLLKTILVMLAAFFMPLAFDGDGREIEP